MHHIRNVLRHWLPLAVVITALCLLVYGVAQQVLRQSANDPQIQMAHDAADALAQGQLVDSVLPTAKIDVARSLAPFLMLFRDDGQVLASSGLLRGQPPKLPSGVLEYTRRRGEDRVTWEPERGVRIAAVVVRYEGDEPGFVLAGRSLQEIERRETQAELIAFLALLATLAASLVAVIVGELILAEKSSAD